jgi:hypothetical protein
MKVERSACEIGIRKIAPSWYFNPLTVGAPFHARDLPTNDLFLGSLSDFLIDFTYDLASYSDPFRLVKTTRICSFAVSPEDEIGISVILSDGKVLFWNLDQKFLPLPSTADPVNENTYGNQTPLAGVVFVQLASPYVLHMCPPMTAKNRKDWKPFIGHR